MARIRTIKPSFFQSEDVSALPLRARLTWIGLWTQCDDRGRTKDNVRLIKAGIWPLDNVSLADIEEDLSTLSTHGRIVRYEVGGERFLEVVNWNEHQKINRATDSKYPPPPESSVNGHGRLTEHSLSTHAGKGKEGKGRDARARDDPPSLKCPEHQHLAKPPPCGPCADARRAHDQWQTERNQRIADAPQCRVHQGQLAHNCGLCRFEELDPP